MKPEKQKYDYFWMSSTLGPRHIWGVACSPKNWEEQLENKPSVFYDSIAFFKDLDEVPFIYELEDGILSDYLCDDMGFPLFSSKLKDIIETNVLNKVHTRWLKVKVHNPKNDEITTYHMPLFENLVDAIDYEHSDCDPDMVSIACYSLKKIKDLDFFPEHDKIRLRNKEDDTKPYFVDNHFIVSKRFKDILVKNKITGVEFMRVIHFNDLNPELEKQWDEVIDYWDETYSAIAKECNVLFNLDFSFLRIKRRCVLYPIKGAAIYEELKAYDIKYSTEDGLPPSKELEESDYNKYREIEDQYKIDFWQAIKQGYEIIEELTEEEYIKNNLRRLFECYDDTTHTGSYVLGEIRQAYGAIGVPALEIMETLAGKTPIKDENGIIRFLALPLRIAHRGEALYKAALAVKAGVEKAITERKTCTPEYIFSKYRKIKNKSADGDERRINGSESEQQQQRVKDYAREIINDTEKQRLREYDGWLSNLMIKEADARWQGRSGEELEELRKHAEWSRTHVQILT